MSWPRPALPSAPSDATIRRLLDDAQQQLATGNPQQALQTVLHILSSMNLHGEVAAAATRVRDAMAKDPSSKSAAAQLAGLLGTLTLSSSSPTTAPQPPPREEQLDNDMEMAEASTSSDRIVFWEETKVKTSQKNVVINSIDGEASFICSQCGAVISIGRKSAHEQTWCPALANSKIPP